MVDLAAPRAPGFGNLRYNNSDANLGGRFGNGSSTSLAKHTPIVDSNASIRTGTPLATPTLPATPASVRKNTENPLNVRFGDDSEGSPPGTPFADTEPKGSLEQFEFGLGVRNDTQNHEHVTTNGYPSPPPSINSAERPSSSRRNQPSALRNVDTVGPMSLPSPAASSRESEDVWDAPVIRNVQAKRDTLTFHPPRRQSVSMALEEEEKAQHQKNKKSDESSDMKFIEGFTGNFAGFDFGESVRRASVGMNLLNTIPKSSPEPTSAPTSAPAWERKESPLSGRKRSPTLEERRAEAERQLTDSGTPARVSPEQPVRQISPLAERHHQTAHLPPQTRPPTSPIPPPPPKASPRQDRAPFASNGPQPPPRPGYINRPLDPPPRGFRPRAGPEARPPHRPPGIRLPPQLVDRSAPRSPYGPPIDDSSYMRSEPSPRPPPDVRPQTTITNRAIEGDFPMSKGLPRGRPPRVDSMPDSPRGLGPGPRPQQRQRPLYPPAKPEPSPTEQPNLSPQVAANHRYTLPNWEDFDHSDPHRSAIPAPLSPFRPEPPASPMRPPRSPPKDSPTSPAWPFNSQSSTPISPTPPSLPSPSFQSLEKSISSSNENLAKTFEMAAKPKPLISPVTDWDRSPGAMRVEAKKAPPRPTPITLPPNGVDPGLRTPNAVADGFTPAFI